MKYLNPDPPALPGTPIDLQQFKCLRCDHSWLPTRPEIPLSCPSCHSWKWQLPKGDNLSPGRKKILKNSRKIERGKAA